MDTGIRYYRPKPYLLVEPAESEVTNTGAKTITKTPSDEFVKVSLEYLPDFSEEYSIDVRPGLGTANVSVKLEQGWNLTSINQELDSQFDENVKAIAELAGAAAKFVPTSALDGAPAASKKRWVVAATNVPIGYYESVISNDSCGKKRLFGWRYVGFMPYAACPTEVCGVDQIACQDVNAPLFGLVFRNGVMTFQELMTLKDSERHSRRAVGTGEFDVAASTEARLKQLATSIRLEILKEYGLQSDVTAFTTDGSDVDLQITLDGKLVLSRTEFIKTLLPLVEQPLVELGNPMPRFSAINGLDNPRRQISEP